MIKEGAGQLLVRLRDHQKTSGSGSSFAVAHIVVDTAERAAFARTALAVKLRELNTISDEIARLTIEETRVMREVRAIANECSAFDADLEAAIDGRLRR